jgi:uncharacterized protein YdeI (YjbR/CyaY-like superfamily)
MAAFKQHCAFTLWKGALITDHYGQLTPAGETTMGHLGAIRTLKNLPPDDVLLDYLRQAVELNEKGIKLPPRNKNIEKKELVVPDDLLLALSLNPQAELVFEKFSYSHKKEYLEWIQEAKTEATRQKRINTTVEWLLEGKGRNWKHLNKA